MATSTWPLDNGQKSQSAPKERRRRRAEKRFSKGCFWRVRFFSALLRFSGPFRVVRANLKGAEKKRTIQKHPFGQPFLRKTPSPLLWRTLKKRATKITPIVFALCCHLAAAISIPPSSTNMNAFVVGGVQMTLILILLQKHRDTNGRRIVRVRGRSDSPDVARGVTFKVSCFHE